jgi:hypothetical protein
MEHGRAAFDFVMGICDGFNNVSEQLKDVERLGNTTLSMDPKENPNAPIDVQGKKATAAPLPRFPASMPTKVPGVPLGVLKELVKASESGEFGGYDALAWHPNYKANAMSRPLDADGFPMWEGSSATGKGSHGAGAYQFEPELWKEFAPKLGIKDFSPASQDRVAEAAIMRYGIFPWRTDKKLIAAIKEYQRTGKVPTNLVSHPAPDLSEFNMAAANP